MVFKRTGFIQSREIMSRRDDTLSSHCAVPAGLFIEQEAYPVRRLKSTVNKMSSLRDLLADRCRSISLPWINPVRLKTLICCLFFISKPSEV